MDSKRPVSPLDNSMDVAEEEWEKETKPDVVNVSDEDSGDDDDVIPIPLPVRLRNNKGTTGASRTGNNGNPGREPDVIDLTEDGEEEQDEDDDDDDVMITDAPPNEEIPELIEVEPARAQE